MIREEKRSLRRALVAAREAIPAERRKELGQAAGERVLQLAEVHRAGTVMAFLSVGGEIPTATLLSALLAAGKRLLVPRITESGLVPVILASADAVVAGAHGIPTGGGPAWSDGIDVVIVPGAGFTREGERLGLGKAYYDRFLASREVGFSCGLCFDEQVVEVLPVEAHDRPVDAVATPTALYRR